MRPCLPGLLAACLLLSGTPRLAAQEPRATLSFERPSVEVGEPVRATLRVEHPAGALPQLAGLGLDDSWVVFESAAPQRSPELTSSTWVFEIASLEPGERKLVEIPLKLALNAIAVEAQPLSVRGVLAAEEDAARALHGPGELDLAESTPAATWGLLCAGLLALLALGAWLVLRRRKALPERAPAPSTRLAVLESRPLDSAEDVQAAHFALTRLLREAADLRLGQDRSGLTDEEWRLAARAQFDAVGLDEGQRAELEALLERAGAVKYGRERPTHWATREALASARLLAARLEPAAEAAA